MSWGVTQNGGFFVQDIENKLFNAGKLPIILVNSCYTAAFQFDIGLYESVGETVIRKEGGGAIAYWGASDITGLDPTISMAYQFMVENNPYTFSLGELFLNQYLCKWLFGDNLLGDPALTISRVTLEQDKAELEVAPVDINFNPKFSKPSEDTKISATIHNLGNKKAADVLVKFFLGDPKYNGIEIGSKTITNIFAEGTETTEINWTPDLPIGEYKIYVVIDPYDTIPESGTINNTAYKPIEVNIYQSGWYQFPLFWYRLECSAGVGNIDGDGDLEVVILGEYVYIWHHNGEFVNNWPKLLTEEEEEGDIFGIPILANIDNDGELEIIFSGTKKFYVLNHDGSNVPGFPKQGGTLSLSSPAIGDIDGDGDMEIVVEIDNKLYAFHHDGTLVDGDWPKEINLHYAYHPIIADIDKNGNSEIIAFAEGKVYVFNSAGSLIAGQWPRTIPYPNGIPDVFAVGNIDEDKELEIVIASEQNSKILLSALNHDGSDVSGYPKQIGEINSGVPYSVVLGDIDNDENMEVIIDTRNYLYVLHHDGSNVPGWPKAGNQRGPSYALVSDMNNDKQLEIIESKCVDGYGKGTITIWNNDGNLKGNLFMKPGDEKTSPFVIADIDLDGDVEVICAGEEPLGGWDLPKIYIWDYEGKCEKGSLEWPMANHDARRTNCYNTDVKAPAKIEDLNAIHPTPYTIDLSWTSPGDDYNLGTSSYYYIRYATFTITPANWHLTDRATCTITPKPAGSQESFTVTDLEPKTTYYFCIRARDDEFNTSPLSNVPFATTLSPAIITISPTQGAVGKIVTLWGNNFYPTESIRISFGKTLTVAFVNAVAGSFTLTFTITDEGFGSVTVTGYGFESGYTATTQFFIPDVEYFVIGTISSPQVAGQQGFEIKITAFNEYGEVVTNFKGTATLSDISNTILPTVTSNFIAGIWQGTVTITKAGTTSITASYAGKIGTSNPFYVKAGTPTKFIVNPQNSVDVPAGGSVSITAQLMDAYDNPVGSAGITCNVEVVVIAGTSGILSAATTTTNQSGQIATITYFVSPHASDKVKVKVEVKVKVKDSEFGIQGYSGTITTIPAELQHFTFDPIGTQTAGVDFPIRITAKDIFGNTVDGFTGTVTLTDITGTLIPPPSSPIPFTAGIWQGTVTITKAGTTAITSHFLLPTSHLISGTSNTFFVTPTDPDYFVIGTVTNQTAGTPFTITITAKDRFGNTAEGFILPATLTDTSNTIYPTTTTNFTAGTWQGTVTITKAGTTAITSHFLLPPSHLISGTSNPFFVAPAEPDYFVIGTITNQTAGIPFTITITAKDIFGNTAVGFISPATLTDTSNTIYPTTTTNFTAGI